MNPAVWIGLSIVGLWLYGRSSAPQQQQGQRLPDGSVLLPDGRVIRPSGQVVRGTPLQRVQLLAQNPSGGALATLGRIGSIAGIGNQLDTIITKITGTGLKKLAEELITHLGADPARVDYAAWTEHIQQEIAFRNTQPLPTPEATTVEPAAQPVVGTATAPPAELALPPAPPGQTWLVVDGQPVLVPIEPPITPVVPPVITPEPALTDVLTASPDQAGAALANVPGGERAAAALADGSAQIVDVTGPLGADPIAATDLTSEGASAVAPVEGALPESFAGIGPVSNLGPVLQGLAIAGLAIDIGFTIASNKPDAVKAIDSALDTAAIVCLVFAETGVGIVLAVVIEVVKFVFDLFSGSLFGGTQLSHAQREALETARYGQNLAPMFPELSHALTPRELLATLIRWGSGYCGGIHNIAMATQVLLPAGTVVRVGALDRTLAAPTILPIGAPGCYFYQASAGESWGAIWAPMSFDEEALILAAHPEGFSAEAQAGITESLKTPFNDQTIRVVEARVKPMTEMLRRGLSLDEIDAVAAEFRRQPKLAAVANFYGFRTWQTLVGAIAQKEWAGFTHSRPAGSVSDFARTQGYPTSTAWRDGVLRSWEAFYDRTVALTKNIALLEASGPKVLVA